MPLSAIHIYIRDLDRRVTYEQGWLLLRTINSILHGVRRGMASVAEISHLTRPKGDYYCHALVAALRLQRASDMCTFKLM